MGLTQAYPNYILALGHKTALIIRCSSASDAASSCSSCGLSPLRNCAYNVYLENKHNRRQCQVSTAGHVNIWTYRDKYIRIDGTVHTSDPAEIFWGWPDPFLALSADFKPTAFNDHIWTVISVMMYWHATRSVYIIVYMWLALHELSIYRILSKSRLLHR